MPRAARIVAYVLAALLAISAFLALALLGVHQFAPDAAGLAINIDGHTVRLGQWSGSLSVDMIVLWSALTASLFLAGIALTGALLLTVLAVAFVALLVGLPLLLMTLIVWLVFRATGPRSSTAQA
ncbi:MAG: hypothetical protein JNL19_06735 [Burkholderiales bacterium]|nr:hypothetical protein [Burkholderiales bacterium]